MFALVSKGWSNCQKLILRSMREESLSPGRKGTILESIIDLYWRVFRSAAGAGEICRCLKMGKNPLLPLAIIVQNFS